MSEIVKFMATLFGEGEDGSRFELWSGEVSGEDEDEARERVIENEWDDRLRGASCSPVVMLREIKAE